MCYSRPRPADEGALAPHSLPGRPLPVGDRPAVRAGGGFRGWGGAVKENRLKLYTCMYACMYVRMNVCMYVYIYIHVCVLEYPRRKRELVWERLRDGDLCPSAPLAPTGAARARRRETWAREGDDSGAIEMSCMVVVYFALLTKHTSREGHSRKEIETSYYNVERGPSKAFSSSKVRRCLKKVSLQMGRGPAL